MRRVLVDKGPRLSLRSNCCRSSRSRAGTSRSRSYSARKYRPTATWSSVNRASVRIEASGSSIPCEGFPMGSPIVWSGGPAYVPSRHFPAEPARRYWHAVDVLLSRLYVPRGGEPVPFPELGAILSAHQPMEFYGPEAGLIGAVPAPGAVSGLGARRRGSE